MLQNTLVIIIKQNKNFVMHQMKFTNYWQVNMSTPNNDNCNTTEAQMLMEGDDSQKNNEKINSRVWAH